MKPILNRALMPTAALIIVIIDQFTKYRAEAALKHQADFMLIYGILSFSYTENTGAAFSSFLGMRYFLIVMTALVLCVLLWRYRCIPSERRYLPLKACFVMICAGAIGNLIDRVRLGYVIDFIYFIPINFPRFNLADSFIVVGAILLCLLLIFYYSDEDMEILLKL